MKRINLIYPNDSLIISDKFLNLLDLNFKKRINRAINLLSAKKTLGEIKNILIDLSKDSKTSFSLMDINKYAFYGAVSMYVSLFNTGGVLNKNNIKNEGGTNESTSLISFHSYLINFRNTYLCHRDTLIRRNGMFFITKDDNDEYIVTDNGVTISPSFDGRDLNYFLELIDSLDEYISENLIKVNDFLNEHLPQNIFNEYQVKNDGINDGVLDHQTTLMKSIYRE